MKLVLSDKEAHVLYDFFQKMGVLEQWCGHFGCERQSIASIHPAFHDMFGGRLTEDFLMAYTPFTDSTVTLKFFKNK